MVRKRSPQLESIKINIDTEGATIRVGGYESLSRAAPDIEHSRGPRQWRGQHMSGVARIECDL